MENGRAKPSLVDKGKGNVAPPADDEAERRVLLEKLRYSRAKLAKTLVLSANADKAISKLKATAGRLLKERNEALARRNRLLAELQARENAQVVTALASGPPAAAFTANQAPLGGMTMQEMHNYAPAAGASSCFAYSPARTDSFDPDKFLVDAAEGDSVLPCTATAMDTGSGASGMAGKKKNSFGGDLGLVAEQILRQSQKKEDDGAGKSG